MDQNWKVTFKQFFENGSESPIMTIPFMADSGKMAEKKVIERCRMGGAENVIIDPLGDSPTIIIPMPIVTQNQE